MVQSHTAPVSSQERARSAAAVVKLLRSLAAGTDAKASRHDVIFLTAAARIERLEADLLECREYIETEVDVIDGSNGELMPNRAMALVSMIDETLNGAA